MNIYCKESDYPINQEFYFIEFDEFNIEVYHIPRVTAVISFKTKDDLLKRKYNKITPSLFKQKRIIMMLMESVLKRQT